MKEMVLIMDAKAEERQNTERERKRADDAEKRIQELEKYKKYALEHGYKEE